MMHSPYLPPQKNVYNVIHFVALFYEFLGAREKQQVAIHCNISLICFPFATAAQDQSRDEGGGLPYL